MMTDSTLKQAHFLMKNGSFQEAVSLLNNVRKEHSSDSAFYLLCMLCGYQADSMVTLFGKVAGSPIALTKLIRRSDWDKIKKFDPEYTGFVDHVKEYLELSLLSCGTNLEQMDQKTQGLSNKRDSTFGGMDAEEKHNAARANAGKGRYQPGRPGSPEDFENLLDDYDKHSRTVSSFNLDPDVQLARVVRAAVDEYKIRDAREIAKEARDNMGTPGYMPVPPLNTDSALDPSAQTMTAEQITDRRAQLLNTILSEEEALLS